MECVPVVYEHDNAIPCTRLPLTATCTSQLVDGHKAESNLAECHLPPPLAATRFTSVGTPPLLDVNVDNGSLQFSTS
jgi:hypothetical protein